jgi:hypothetical protein
LIAVSIVGEEDCPGTGTPNGVLLAELAQGFDEIESDRQLADGCGFATRHDQPIQPLELVRKANLDHFHTQAFQCVLMLDEITLQCKDANFHNSIVIKS